MHPSRRSSTATKQATGAPLLSDCTASSSGTDRGCSVGSGYNPPPQQYAPPPPQQQQQNQYSAVPVSYGNAAGDSYAMQAVNGNGTQSLIGSDLGPFFAEVRSFNHHSLGILELGPGSRLRRLGSNRYSSAHADQLVLPLSRSSRFRTRSSSCTRTSTMSRSFTLAASLQPTT